MNNKNIPTGIITLMPITYFHLEGEKVRVKLLTSVTRKNLEMSIKNAQKWFY